MISGQGEKALTYSKSRFTANASDSIFQSGAGDVYISRKKEISVQGKYLYASIIRTLKIVYPPEGVRFVYPSNVPPFLERGFLKSSTRGPP